MKKIASMIFAMFMGIALAIGGGVLLSGCGNEKLPEKSSVSVEDGGDNQRTEGEATLPERKMVTFDANGGSFVAPTRTYQISNLSMTNYGYGFEANAKGWLESQNKGVSSSFSMIRIYFNAEISSASFSIKYISYGESNFDYVIFGNIDSALSESNTADSSYYKSAKGESSAEEKTITYSNISSGNHYIYVKFIKDGSVNSYNDSVQIWFETDFSNNALNNGTWKYEIKDMMYGTLPTATRTGYEFKGWYINADDNMVPPLSQWSYTGGAYYDTSTGAAYLPNADSFVVSPLIYVGDTNINTDLMFHVYADYMCPTAATSTNGDMFKGGTDYYNGSKTHYSGNGWSSKATPGVWTNLGFTMWGETYIGSDDCQYITIYYNRSETWANEPFYVRNVRMLVPDSEGCKVTESSTVESFTTLYAHWEPNKYTATFNAGSGDMIAPLENWNYAGGAYYDEATGSAVLPNMDSTVSSPLIHVADTSINKFKYCTFNGDFRSSVVGPEMFHASVGYYNADWEWYNGNGWSSRTTTSEWTNISFTMGHGDQYIGTGICHYIAITFSRNSTYAPNEFSVRNVKFWINDEEQTQLTAAKYSYNTPYGNLPTPTRENYRFDGWKKGEEKQVLNELSFDTSTGAFSHEAVAYCKPGATYHLRIKKAEVTGVASGYSKPTLFSVVMYDYTANINYGTNNLAFGEDIEHVLHFSSSANANNNLVLLIYSGVAGSATGIGTSYSGISVVEETETIVSSTSTYNTLGHQILYAKWTPESIGQNVFIRTLSENGNTVSESSLGGTVKVEGYQINGTTSTFTTLAESQTSTGATYYVHKGQQFKITANANSGYAFVGFSTNPTPSESIKKPSVMPSNILSYSPTTNGQQIAFFKKLSPNQLKYDVTSKYFYFEDGEYPQSYAGTWSSMQGGLTATGETIEFVDPTGRNSSVSIYRNSSGVRYAKVVAPKTCTLNLKNQTGTSSSNVSFTAGVSYMFKFEPIRWRVSKYGVSTSEKPSGFENFSSYKTNFSVTSDLILGFGAMKLELDAREGDCVRDFEGFTSVENLINGCDFDFGFCLSTVNFGIDSYSRYASGQANAVTSSILSYNSSMRLASVSGTAAGGRIARASNMVAMLMGSDDTNVSYWTRDLSNLNSGIAITPTGTIIRPWLNQVHGMRFSYTFTEGSNAGGGILIDGQSQNVEAYVKRCMNLSYDKTSDTYTLSTIESNNDPFYVIANHYCYLEAGQTYIISAKVTKVTGEAGAISVHLGTGPWNDKGYVNLEASNGGVAYYTAPETGRYYFDFEPEGDYGHTAGAVIKVEGFHIYKI